MANYSAVFFDMDGTLNDSGPGIMNSVRWAMRKLGHAEPDEETLRKFIGPSLMYSFQTFTGLSEAEAEAATAAYRECYRGGEIFHMTVYDGIRELLADLNRAGVRCAVVTSKPTMMTDLVLDHFDLRKHFSAVASPRPEDISNDKSFLIQKALELLSLRPEEVVMVGDTRFDMRGAKKAGCDSIGVTYGYGTEAELRENGADFLVGSPEEIRRIVGI